MAHQAPEAFASRLAALAATYPSVSSLTPSTYTAADGKTTYAATFTLLGVELPFQTEASTSPLAASRIVQQTLISTLARYANRLPHHLPA